MKTNNIKNMRFTLLALAIAAVPIAAIAAEGDGNPVSDVWLESRLATTYTLNDQLDAFYIDVDVNKGVAVISGTVENEVERDLAVEIAKGTEGVKSVDDRLVIAADAKRQDDNKFGKWVKDSTLEARVKSRLLWNNQIDGTDIEVDARDGLVTLSGRADDRESAELATHLAQNTSGVRTVAANFDLASEPSMTDKLGSGASKAAENTKSVVGKVAGGTKSMAGNVADSSKAAAGNVSNVVSDAWVTSKVRSMIVTDRRFSLSDVDVNTKKGVVTLSGTVESKADINTLRSEIAQIKGVTKVESKLQVDQAS